MKNNNYIGYMLVLIGGSLWGVGGTVAQRLFQKGSVSVEWLVSVRLLLSGVIMVALALTLKNRNKVWGIWKDKKAVVQLLFFSILGILTVQYTYMASISHGNAAIATLLQYLAPVFIMLYLLITGKTKLQIRYVVAIVLALTGTFLLLSNGSLSTLSVPYSSVVWGILSGVAMAFYTLYAGPLLNKWGSLNIIGWAMVIGGVVLGVFNPPWQANVTDFSFDTLVFLIFVIFFGTMFAFWFYLESLKYLNAQETSLLGSIEPLSAILTSVLWLKIPFGIYQWLGGFMILLMVFYISMKKEAGSDKFNYSQKAKGASYSNFQ
ncbi:Permease of the drug/metabolite transporter (DMT) superfamily [Marininema mesophilum]|uniref:Permease of the drug/metabolite transporter (DMT) superfamily n=1 Tax=Marininema mesophilum TaxID=1048340 RepID=A0A1H2XCK2_9BACL|nr:EamA family transporter [Marininema mesophilum]SDW90174.1 Permease of the drug/metabolite transporter (DMT) superfamily [Marininema mesophilum]